MVRLAYFPHLVSRFPLQIPFPSPPPPPPLLQIPKSPTLHGHRCPPRAPCLHSPPLPGQPPLPTAISPPLRPLTAARTCAQRSPEIPYLRSFIPSDQLRLTRLQLLVPSPDPCRGKGGRPIRFLLPENLGVYAPPRAGKPPESAQLATGKKPAAPTTCWLLLLRYAAGKPLHWPSTHCTRLRIGWKHIKHTKVCASSYTEHVNRTDQVQICVNLLRESSPMSKEDHLGHWHLLCIYSLPVRSSSSPSESS